MKAEFLHNNVEVEMFIKWTEGIVDLVIITKEFMEEYCIFIERFMYGNVDT